MNSNERLDKVEKDIAHMGRIIVNLHDKVTVLEKADNDASIVKAIQEVRAALYQISGDVSAL